MCEQRLLYSKTQLSAPARGLRTERITVQLLALVDAHWFKLGVSQEHRYNASEAQVCAAVALLKDAANRSAKEAVCIS